MTMVRGAIPGIIACGMASFDVLAQTVVPVPKPKPIVTAVITIPVPVPIPRVKPEPRRRPAPATNKPWPKNFGNWPAAEVQEERAHCVAILASRDMIWRPDQPIGEPGGCGTPAPIAIAEVSGV